PTSAGKDTLHKRDQPLKKLAYVSNHWGPLLCKPVGDVHLNPEKEVAYINKQLVKTILKSAVTTSICDRTRTYNP
ncbi:hypothetical protein, partial [Vibrio parahaemolyticus]|uniref:hypothetical protein n=1 Tax=Vibrio parahaemolyticus TaxID=670 RepID=UPI0024066BD4